MDFTFWHKQLTNPWRNTKFIFVKFPWLISSLSQKLLEFSTENTAGKSDILKEDIPL